ncbi:unnamed protein product [Prorocentrum cordatum]|uniref:Guanine nucleotide-binding protein subunit beta-like protein n=1 Tax=Prorocentrum cordatum TaxID=2364126 RepID=A0ABN9XAB6_9DINO|nr:unnamed protein product [Polarella glacialis]
MPAVAGPGNRGGGGDPVIGRRLGAGASAPGPAMLVSVVACSGRELAALEADPSWQLGDLLVAVPKPEGAAGHWLRIFFGETELCGVATLGEIGVQGGSELTLVVTRSRRMVTCHGHEAKIWAADSGECLRTLIGHEGYVTSAVLSADGQQALTASCDRTAKVWGASSGECLRTLVGHRGRVTSAALSMDGQRALTAAWDGTARVWGINSGECLRTLVGHHGHVTSASFSVDGQQVLTASSDSTAKVWAASSGECLRTLEGHHGHVWSAVFSVDGQQVLTASSDSTAKVWAADSGDCLRTLVGHQDSVTSAVFSPDGQRVLTASWDATANVWAADSGECLLRAVVAPRQAAPSGGAGEGSMEALGVEHRPRARGGDLR